MQLFFRVLGAALVMVLVWGLVVVAAARVREAAARTQCRNNLKQIGIGLWGYTDGDGHFPAATIPNDDLPSQQRLSWLVSLGPYIEASDFFYRLDRNKGWNAEENRYLCFSIYKCYQCPAFPERPPISTMVSAHYLGIAGLGADAAELPSADNPRVGFFGYERQLTPAGLAISSNTLVALESLQIQGSWTAGGQPTVRGLESGATPYLGADGQFGGLHRAGINALFADASVRSLPQSLDPAVLEAMTTLQGSKTMDPPNVP